MMNETFHALGSRAVGALGVGLDLRQITAPAGWYPFGSLLLETEGVETRFCFEDGEASLTVSDAATGEAFARVYDRRAAKSEVVTRRVVTERPLVFTLASGPYVERFGAATDGLSFWLRLPGGLLSEGKLPSRESYLYFTFRGDVRPEGEKMVFEPGEGVLIISGGERPDLVFGEARRAAAKLDRGAFEAYVPRVSKRAARGMSDRAASALGILSSLRSPEGFCLSSLDDPVCDPVTQYLAVSAFAAAGMNAEAREIADAYLTLWRRDGGLTWSGADTARKALSANEASVTPALAALSVFRAYGENPPEKYHEMIAGLIENSASVLYCGTVPFNGNEQNDVARYLCDRASSAATMLFIEAASRAGALLAGTPYAPGKETLGKLRNARERFHAEFTSEGSPLLYSNCRLNSRAIAQPKIRYGYCAACSPLRDRPHPVWTVLTPEGDYLCFECAGDTGAKSKIYFDPLARQAALMNGPRAAFLGSDLYLRGMIRQTARAVLTEPAASVRVNYEYGLLLWTAKTYGLEDEFVSLAAKYVDASCLGTRDPLTGEKISDAPVAASCAAIAAADLV